MTKFAVTTKNPTGSTHVQQNAYYQTLDRIDAETADKALAKSAVAANATLCEDFNDARSAILQDPEKSASGKANAQLALSNRYSDKVDSINAAPMSALTRQIAEHQAALSAAARGDTPTAVSELRAREIRDEFKNHDVLMRSFHYHKLNDAGQHEAAHAIENAPGTPLIDADIIFYIVAAVLGLSVSYMSFVFSLLGGERLATIMGASLVTAHICATIFAVMKAKQKNVGLAVLALVSPAFLVYVVALIFSLGQSLFMSYAPDPKFTSACEDVGVQIFNAPAAPVTSIHLDWDAVSGDVMGKYITSSDKHLEHFERSVPYPELIIDSSNADALVAHEVSNPDEAGKGLRNQGLIKYTLTVTDRRDGRKLATMKYAVDIVKRHACGSNVKDAIDLDAFLRRATTMPGQASAPSATTSIQDIQPEILETEIYSPERSFGDAEFNDYFFDKKREQKCEGMLPRIGPNRRQFSSDRSALKSMSGEEPWHVLCDDNTIFHVTFDRDKNGWHYLITKYKPSGELQYTIKFLDLGKFQGYTGGIVEPTLQIRDGYLFFDWLNSDRSGSGNFASRRLKLRVREPFTISPVAGDASAPPIAKP